MNGLRLSVVVSPLVAAIVGFGGTLALVVAAADAVGATREQTASWVAAMCLAVAVETLYLSWRTRMPVIAAWSAPGAALLAASNGFTMNDAVGAFLIAGAMLFLTGLIGPLTRLASKIPSSVASGMLVGIVVGFVVAAAQAIGADPVLILPLAIAFFLIGLFNPALSVVAVLVGGVILSFALGRIDTLPVPELSRLVWTQPHFSLAATVGLAVPMYLTTMASQNLSGLAILKAAGYSPPAGLLIATTGLGSVLSAPFNSLTTNLAAISAAICTGPDAHPDPHKRWLTGPFYAFYYVVIAAFAAYFVALFADLPPGFIVLVAGLGLLGPLINALTMAVAEPAERTPAVVAFVVTASGLTVAGIGSAFWGLVAGLLVLGLGRLRH